LRYERQAEDRWYMDQGSGPVVIITYGNRRRFAKKGGHRRTRTRERGLETPGRNGRTFDGREKAGKPLKVCSAERPRRRLGTFHLPGNLKRVGNPNITSGNIKNRKRKLRQPTSKDGEEDRKKGSFGAEKQTPLFQISKGPVQIANREDYKINLRTKPPLEGTGYLYPRRRRKDPAR